MPTSTAFRCRIQERQTVVGKQTFGKENCWADKEVQSAALRHCHLFRADRLSSTPIRLKPPSRQSALALADHPHVAPRPELALDRPEANVNHGAINDPDGGHPARKGDQREAAGHQLANGFHDRSPRL